MLAGLVVASPKETVALYNLMQAKRYDKALALYRWFMSLMRLDVSTKLVQNLKLVETMAGVDNEFVRRPRQPLVGAERERVSAVVRKALETRPDVSAYL